MSLILGAHMSIKDGFLAAAEEAVTVLHANAMQCFVRSPRGGAAKPLLDTTATEFREYIQKQKMTVVVHSPYLLNLSKPYKTAAWAVKLYIDDLKRCEQLGALGAVLHMGKALGGDAQQALQIMAENVRRVLDETKQFKTHVIIENTAGQGSEIGYHFEDIAKLFKLIGKSPRLSCCFDTAHAFAAGYDLKTEAGWKKTKDTIEQTIGWKKISCIQLNDSKKPLASRVDRHENIGKGFIGKDGLMRVVRFAKTNSIPLLLETPLGLDFKGHERDLKLIRNAIS